MKAYTNIEKRNTAILGQLELGHPYMGWDKQGTKFYIGRVSRKLWRAFCYVYTQEGTRYEEFRAPTLDKIATILRDNVCAPTTGR